MSSPELLKQRDHRSGHAGRRRIRGQLAAVVALILAIVFLLGLLSVIVDDP
jgi:hypothetical protein